MIENQGTVISLGPWVRGLMNTVTEESLPHDALTVASNVDIDRDGVATSRNTWSQVDAANYTSLFKHNMISYAVRNGSVGVLGDASFTAISAVANPVAWTVLDDEPVYTDYVSIRRITNGASEPLAAGYYADDEDGLYQLTELPGGSDIHHWQGRLLIVRGNTLYWSEALRYAVYSATQDYIRFESRIRWVAPLPSGIYVGLRNRVVFLRGSDPSEFSIHTVGKKSAPGVAAVYDPRHLGKGSEPLALWFTDVGIAVGDGSGAVTYPQADRLKDMPLYSGKMVVEDDRVYIFTTKEH